MQTEAFHYSGTFNTVHMICHSCLWIPIASKPIDFPQEAGIGNVWLTLDLRCMREGRKMPAD